MFVVEVDIVKQWTDRGGTDWVKIGILGASLVGEKIIEVDVKPADLIQLKRSLIQVHETDVPDFDEEWVHGKGVRNE